MSATSDPVTVENVIGSRIRPATQYREVSGWRLPVTNVQDAALAFKAVHSRPASGDLRRVVTALKQIGRAGAWISDAQLESISRRTGSHMKRLLAVREATNQWLASIDGFLERLGRVGDDGCLHGRGVNYAGGLTTAMVLAGDDFTVAPWSMTQALIAQARMFVKPSSSEPLSAYLFARALVGAGLEVPALIHLDTSQTADVDLLVKALSQAERVVIFGEDSTVETLCARMPTSPAHKVVPYWTGRSGALLLPDCDVALAARHLVQGAAEDRGNKCISTKKAIVHRSLTERLERALVAEADRLRRGDPLDRESDLGGLSPEAWSAAERLASAGRIIYDRDLIIAVVDNPRARLLREEHPYPLLGILYYDHDDPVQLANDLVRETASGSALNMSVFTASDADYRRIAPALRASKILHNEATTSIDPHQTHQGMHLCLELMRPFEVLGGR